MSEVKVFKSLYPTHATGGCVLFLVQKNRGADLRKSKAQAKNETMIHSSRSNANRNSQDRPGG